MFLFNSFSAARLANTSGSIFFRQAMLQGIQQTSGVPVIAGNTATITAVTPNGVPDMPFKSTQGMGEAEQFSIYMDNKAKAGTTGSEKITLFDSQGYNAARGLVSENPLNVVWMESPTENIYEPFLGEFCGKSQYTIAGLVLYVTAAVGSSYTVESFLDTKIKVLQGLYDGTQVTKEIDLSIYQDPNQQNKSIIHVAPPENLRGLNSRTAWVFDVPNGLQVKAVFGIVGMTK